MDEIIRRFNREKIRYLLIGGQAMRLKGMPRFSMDWDFFIPPHDQSNIRQINTVLEDVLDFPLVPLGAEGENVIQTYQTDWGVLQFHLGGPGFPPFAEAADRGVVHTNESGITIKCISGPDLLAAKRACNRPQDQQDIQFLEKKQELGLLE